MHNHHIQKVRQVLYDTKVLGLQLTVCALVDNKPARISKWSVNEMRLYHPN